MNTRKRLLALSLAVMIFTLIPNLPISEANLSGKAFNSSTMSVNTGKYMAAAVSTTGAANPMSTLALTIPKGVAGNQYWYVKNFGDYPLTGFTLNDTVVVSGGNTIAAGICVGGTRLFVTPNNGVCGGGGTYTLIATLVNGANSNHIVLTIATGATVEVEYRATKNATDTVSISVARTDIRTGTTTNS